MKKSELYHYKNRDYTMLQGMEDVMLSIRDIEMMAMERHADHLRGQALLLVAEGDLKQATLLTERADSMWELIRMDGHDMTMNHPNGRVRFGQI